VQGSVPLGPHTRSARLRLGLLSARNLATGGTSSTYSVERVPKLVCTN
jgi:hypothetical protein